MPAAVSSVTPPLDTCPPPLLRRYGPAPAHGRHQQHGQGPYVRPSTAAQEACTAIAGSQLLAQTQLAQPQGPPPAAMRGQPRWQFHPDCWRPCPPPLSPTAAMMAQLVPKWAPRPPTNVPAPAKSRAPLPKPKAWPASPMAIVPDPAPRPSGLLQLLNAASTPATNRREDTQATLADFELPPVEVWTNFHYFCHLRRQCRPLGPS